MCYTNNYILLFYLECLGDMEYHRCGTQITCDTFINYNNSNCTSGLAGCFCISDYVLEDGMCIHPDTCPSKF